MCGGGNCVDLHAFKPSVQIERISPPNQAGAVEVRGFLHLKPRTFAKKGLYLFQQLAKVEKIIHIATEIFHLFHRFLKASVRTELYCYFSQLHEGAHALSEGLHAVTILNDFLSMAAGKFIVRSHSHDSSSSIDYVRTAARVCHFAAHVLTTASFLDKLKIIPLGIWGDRLVKCGSGLTALSYAIYAVSLVWRRLKGNSTDHHFLSDLTIQASGFFIEGLFLAREFELFSSSVRWVLSKTQSVAIIVQSLCVLNRLSGPDKLKFRTQV